MALPDFVRHRDRRVVALLFPGIEVKLGDAARVALVDQLSVVLVAIFVVAFLGERLSLQNCIGVLIIAGGTIVIAMR